jgi:type I restriction enzyme R subunit
LNYNEQLALEVDEPVRKVRPDSLRGAQPRERVIKAALYDGLQDDAEVERILLIVRAPKKY